MKVKLTASDVKRSQVHKHILHKYGTLRPNGIIIYVGLMEFTCDIHFLSLESYRIKLSAIHFAYENQINLLPAIRNREMPICS